MSVVKPKERWKPVPDYEGLYEVSSLGNVRSVKGGRCRAVKPVPGKQNYLGVSLSKANKVVRVQVHKLVLLAFRGPRPAGLIARHRNGQNQDNKATNLRWGTVTQNNRDTVKHGRHRPGTLVRLERLAAEAQ